MDDGAAPLRFVHPNVASMTPLRLDVETRGGALYLDESECADDEVCGDPDVEGECRCPPRRSLAVVRVLADGEELLRGQSADDGSRITAGYACCYPLVEWDVVEVGVEGDGGLPRVFYGAEARLRVRAD